MAQRAVTSDVLRETRLLEELRRVFREEFIGNRVEIGGGACEGACVGVGSALDIVSGACPNPCDATKYRDGLVRDAKRDAKAKADLKCFFKSMDSDCVCKGDANGYTELERQCYSSFSTDGDESCIYRIYYKFTGTCGKRAV